MGTNNNFQTKFKTLLSKDFSVLDKFDKYSQNNTCLYLIGNVFNERSENLLPNYLKKGNNSLRIIDGDFLIIIVDDNKIVLFRDRQGVGKQIFYTSDYISTQLIDFTTIPDYECKPNLEGIFTFLSIGYIPSPMTSLEGVNKLPAGNVLTYENGEITSLDLFDFDDYISRCGTTKLSLEDAISEYERLHKKSIENRIVGANKVGLLLSGGYDSGGNISALRDIYKGDIVSYSIGFKDNPWTELPLAKILSERFNSTHYEYEINGSEIMDLPKIISLLGDPFNEGGLMVNYSAMRIVNESNESPHVVLGGDGNDQYFGTSGKELALHWKFKTNGLQVFQKLFDTFGNGRIFEKDNIIFRAQFQNRKILHIQQSDTFGFTKCQLRKLNIINYKVPIYRYLQNRTNKYTDFDQFTYHHNYFVDIKQVIDEIILFKAARMAELFSNKISFPYMSTELYHFLKQLPRDYKFHGTLDELSKGTGKSKFLHKSYLKSKLPSEITDRKKQGGFAPLPIFLKDTKQRRLIYEIIEKSEVVNALFDKKKIHNFLYRYENVAESKGYWFCYQHVQANQIINLLTLVVWWKIFICNKNNIISLSELI